MLLKEVFDQLACAELNNINVTDPVTAQINPAMYNRVITAINAGLTQLHTRFFLSRGEVTVMLDPDVEVYELSSKHMMGRPHRKGVTQYIKNNTAFKDNILKIHQVIGPCGRDLHINNYSETWAINELSYNTFQLAYGFLNKHHVSELRIVYRQDHKRINVCCDDLDELEAYQLTLPRSHMWALCLFVASRMHIPVGLQDATYSGNSFMALYNAECSRLDNEGLQLSYHAENHRVRQKGFP